MATTKMLITFFVFIFISNVSDAQYADFKSRYFKDLNDDYRIVMGDYVNVRAEPNTTAKVKLQLKISLVVKIIKESSQEVMINNIKGKWVYVNTGFWNMGDNSKEEPIIHGWIFDTYLAKISDFKRVSSFRDCKMKWWLGDTELKIDFYKNGIFFIVENNTYPGNKKISKYSGEIYQYKNVIYLKHPKSSLYNRFYFSKDNTLCHIITAEHAINERVCCKCK